LLLIESQHQPDQTMNADIQAIKTAGQHLLGLINDVLDFTRLEAEKLDLHMHWFSINDLVANLVNAVKPLALKHGNTLHVYCPPDCGELYSDSTRVRQVLLNVLGNAVKFTDHGQIELHVTHTPATLLHDLEPTPAVIFTIRDTGIGMTPEQQLRLFQEFVQVDDSSTRKYGGSGLGLALSYRLTHLLGGEIHVTSVLGEGSTFTITFPLEQRQMV
jgi:signal transduction histidine kinase